jgi:hypothetical protein
MVKKSTQENNCPTQLKIPDKNPEYIWIIKTLMNIFNM